jgi:hypothetical protein
MAAEVRLKLDDWRPTEDARAPAAEFVIAQAA